MPCLNLVGSPDKIWPTIWKILKLDRGNCFLGGCHIQNLKASVPIFSMGSLFIYVSRMVSKKNQKKSRRSILRGRHNVPPPNLWCRFKDPTFLGLIKSWDICFYVTKHLVFETLEIKSLHNINIVEWSKSTNGKILL